MRKGAVTNICLPRSHVYRLLRLSTYFSPCTGRISPWQQTLAVGLAPISQFGITHTHFQMNITHIYTNIRLTISGCCEIRWTSDLGQQLHGKLREIQAEIWQKGRPDGLKVDLNGYTCKLVSMNDCHLGLNGCHANQYFLICVWILVFWEWIVKSKVWMTENFIDLKGFQVSMVVS
jgi:hypothetical protein